jgi:hypothetical protein
MSHLPDCGGCLQNSTISPTFSIAIAAGNGLFNPDEGECK